MNAARTPGPGLGPRLATPLHLFGALALLTLGGCSGGSGSGDPLIAKGEKIYKVQCLMCHQAEGEGIPDLHCSAVG